MTPSRRAIEVPPWWTQISDDKAFMAYVRAVTEGRPEVKNPCVLCGLELTDDTPIFCNQRGPRGEGSAHLWCSHVLRGAERDQYAGALRAIAEQPNDNSARRTARAALARKSWEDEPADQGGS